MQYPVPQFTDVEDKLIGPLTLRQFIIVGGAGLLIFLLYTATKSLFLLIALIVIIGLPALAVAFLKPNGRPLYRTMPQILRHLFSPKVYIFHRTASGINVVKHEQKPTADSTIAPTDRRTKLRDLNLLLQAKVLEEQVIAQNPDSFQQKTGSIQDLFK